MTGGGDLVAAVGDSEELRVAPVAKPLRRDAIAPGAKQLDPAGLGITELRDLFRTRPLYRAADGLLTMTYLALTCFTALVSAVVPAWLVAVTVQV